MQAKMAFNDVFDFQTRETYLTQGISNFFAN